MHSEAPVQDSAASDAPRWRLQPRIAATLGHLGASLVDIIYPPRCVACGEATDDPHGLCAACWRETDFVSGTACDRCGLPLLGEAGTVAGPETVCDGCRRHPPAWDRGAAALLYRGAGRQMILALKHGDRLDMVRPLAGWMAARGAERLAAAELIVPVPLHWQRLLKRRYNQSAELAKRLSVLSGKPAAVDLLCRPRATKPQEGNRDQRAANQAGAIVVNRRRQALAAGRRILLVDDVLTTGATLSNCADVLKAAGAMHVDVLVIARVAFEDSLHI